MWSSSVLLLFFIGLSANVLSLSIATSEVFRDTRDNSDTNGTTTNVPTTTEEADERKPIQEPEISTNFKIDFVNENGTEIVGPRRTIFEVIPVDYICDFCLNVIDKLKIRQNVEKDFEANIKEECWKYNETIHDDGTICELVNRANLDRLQNDKTSLICIDEHFCDDTRKEDADKKNKGAEFVCNGLLTSFRLAFVHDSQRWKGALATILSQEDSQVWGCVWKVPIEYSEELDKQEHMYHRLTVDVACVDGSTIPCRTYQFSDLQAAEQKPSPHYKTVIVSGAVEHQLPADYIENLVKIEDNGYSGIVEVPLDCIKHLNNH